MIQVYHNTQALDPEHQSHLFAPITLPEGSPRLSDCVLVAVVDVDSLDAAYYLTQHVERPWWDNARARRIEGERQRSTSVGDLLVDEVGVVWVVTGHGFVETGEIDMAAEPARGAVVANGNPTRKRER